MERDATRALGGNSGELRGAALRARKDVGSWAGEECGVLVRVAEASYVRSGTRTNTPYPSPA